MIVRFRARMHLMPFLLDACSAIDPTVAAANGGLTSFTVSASTIEADGAHLDTVLATIDTTFRSKNSPVQFTTTAGSFTNGMMSISAPADSEGTARAFLRSSTDSIEAVVTAAAGGVDKTRRISFVPAYPTWITLIADQPIMQAKPGAATTLTATLVRPTGAVSPGGVIVFGIDGMSSARLTIDSTATNTTGTTRLVLLGSDTGIVTVTAAYSRNRHTASAVAAAIHFIP